MSPSSAALRLAASASLKLLVSGALLVAVTACNKGPQDPSDPVKPAPKTSATSPLSERPMASAEAVSPAMPLPAVPTDNHQKSGLLPKKPARIWM
jgi:hypothetical protein